MKNRITVTISACALAAGATILVAPPAAAEPGARGKLNMWKNDKYEGQRESRKSYDSDLHNDSCAGCDFGPGGDFGDDMSSYVNKTKRWWILYEDDSYSGARVCVRPRSHDRNIGNNTDYEDDISSVEKRGKRKPRGCDDVIGHHN